MAGRIIGTPPATAPGRWSLGEWVTLLVLSGNMLLDALEVSVVFVALPSVGRDLGLSPATVQWLVSGFALGFAICLLFGGRAVRRFGRRRAYLAALPTFAAASLLGGLAGGGAVLIVSRLIKGCCAALTAPTGLAIIGATFPDGPSRNRAVAVYSLFGASGFSAGLLLSGALTEVDWRWTFLFPAPVALALFVLGARFLPPDPPHRPAPCVPTGPAGGQRAVVGGAFVRSALGAASLNGSYWGFLFVGSFYTQTVLGWKPLAAAVAFLPASALPAASALAGRRLVERFGAARLIALGAACPPAGYALLLPLRQRTAYTPGLLPSVLLVGLGYVLCFSALQLQAIAGVPAPRQRATSALYQAAVQIGGAAVLTAVATITGGSDTAGAVRAGGHAALALTTAIGLAGLVVAVSGVLRDRR